MIFFIRCVSSKVFLNRATREKSNLFFFSSSIREQVVFFFALI
nr:MAG TPA: hypothetical protein [Caudoviricetes sp.]